MRYCDDKRYLSFKNWFKKDNRSIFGLDFVYNKVPNELILFDYDAYLKNGVDFRSEYKYFFFGFILLKFFYSFIVVISEIA